MVHRMDLAQVKTGLIAHILSFMVARSVCVAESLALEEEGTGGLGDTEGDKIEYEVKYDDHKSK